MTKAERNNFDTVYGRYLLAEAENRALLDLVGLLLRDRLTDAQLKRKVKHLKSVVERVH